MVGTGLSPGYASAPPATGPRLTSAARCTLCDTARLFPPCKVAAGQRAHAGVRSVGEQEGRRAIVGLRRGAVAVARADCKSVGPAEAGVQRETQSPFTWRAPLRCPSLARPPRGALSSHDASKFHPPRCWTPAPPSLPAGTCSSARAAATPPWVRGIRHREGERRKTDKRASSRENRP